MATRGSIIECGLRAATTWNRPGASRTRVSPTTRSCECVKQGLDVAERGIEVLPLMQPVTVEGGELVLPEGLPLGEHELLELAVRGDEQ